MLGNSNWNLQCSCVFSLYRDMRQIQENELSTQEGLSDSTNTLSSNHTFPWLPDAVQRLRPVSPSLTLGLWQEGGGISAWKTLLFYIWP